MSEDQEVKPTISRRGLLAGVAAGAAALGLGALFAKSHPESNPFVAPTQTERIPTSTPGIGPTETAQPIATRIPTQTPIELPTQLPVATPTEGPTSTPIPTKP